MRVQRFEVPDFGATGAHVSDVFRQVPMLAGNMALNFFQDSWTRKGYIDTRYVPWPKRKGIDNGRGLLIGPGSGHLRRSLRLTSGRGYFEVGTSLPYAKAHNEGAIITVTDRQRAFFWAKHSKAKRRKRADEAEMWKRMALSKKITIPKRQFMGDSAFLRKRIAANVQRAVSTAVDARYFNASMLPDLNRFFARVRTTTG